MTDVIEKSDAFPVQASPDGRSRHSHSQLAGRPGADRQPFGFGADGYAVERQLPGAHQRSARPRFLELRTQQQAPVERGEPR